MDLNTYISINIGFVIINKYLIPFLPVENTQKNLYSLINYPKTRINLVG